MMLISQEAVLDQLQQQDLHTEEKTDSIQSQVSLYALDGHKNPRTLRILSRIGSTNIQLLIDGSSTQNFIRERIAKFMGLQTTDSDHFSVLVGKGAGLHCKKLALRCLSF